MSALAPVADGVLVAIHEFCTTTTTVVLDASDGCLVIDPAVRPDEIDHVADQLRALGRGVVAGFATHPHWDHLLWRPSLGDAPRYATAAAARTARNRLSSNEIKARAAVEDIDVSGLARVTDLAPDASEIPWAGPRAVIVEHRGHAPGHAALLLPDVGVLVAGDMLSDIEVPLLDLDSPDPVADYRAALDTFESLLDRVHIVVPGHGSVGDGSDLRSRLEADRRYLEDLVHQRDSADARLLAGPDWLRREHEDAQAWVGTHT
ncbi:MBL fold metallo-hydrolase [Luteipulveratus mongoliensis]|uniref:Metallo-beta-lactamase domain-containing protein n=1 Tax=Luteipulveratus mongoliensis TaxID=571913 RepID=A0A0K1JLQ4_9MICO|nr:MBL fold metallo-hydrolase [Luteipulveratus mongoliensis]AKU17510.1 hypothetical protein VV02_19460 [Luteipulveratus mongoliensis]